MKVTRERRLHVNQQRRSTGGMFQIHLSTGIVLMLVAGALVGANVPHDAQLPKSGLTYVRQGWPFCFFADWHREDPKRQEEILSDWFGEHPFEPAAVLPRELLSQKEEHGLRFDIIIGFVILIISGIVAETLARVRDGRRNHLNETS